MINMKNYNIKEVNKKVISIYYGKLYYYMKKIKIKVAIT